MLLKMLPRQCRCLVILSSLVLATLSIGQLKDKPVSDDEKKAVLTAIHSVVETQAFVPNVNFKEWDDYLKTQQPSIDKSKTELEFGAAVQKALGEFGFSHMYLMTPQMVDQREHHRVVGIGVMIGPDPKGLLIVRVYPDSAADKAKLVPGDVIVKVEGNKPNTTSAVRGDAGTPVRIEIEHTDGKRQKYTLIREAYSSAEPPSLKMVDANTALLRVPTFDVAYDRQKIEELMTEADKSKNLVIDMRGNPGGAVINLLHLLGMLLPPGSKIGAFVSREDVDRYQKTHPGTVDVVELGKAKLDRRALQVSGNSRVPYFKGNVAVLINGGSGSAAEMAASALHDLRHATIVGTKSVGAVLVSTIRDLTDGFMLQYPLADYVTSGGVRLEGHGVEPDFVVKDPRIPGLDADAPLERAVAIIEKMGDQSNYVSLAA